MIKIILLPLFFLCLPVAAKETKIKALPVSTPEEVGMSPEVLAKIDPALEELIEKRKNCLSKTIRPCQPGRQSSDEKRYYLPYLLDD
jgi:hypothetical protein